MPARDGFPLRRSAAEVEETTARLSDLETMTALQSLELADWRRRIAELYAAIRSNGHPADAWGSWKAAREQLFLTHSQTPLPAEKRVPAHAPRYFPYDASLRVLAGVEESDWDAAVLPASSGEGFSTTRVGQARFLLKNEPTTLAIHWLSGYAGGILVTFRDSTSGAQTYGAGRYLLDTAKGADLGMSDGRLLLDFNFAYQPSCSYDPRWSCPLAPRENWLDMPIRAGECS